MQSRLLGSHVKKLIQICCQNQILNVDSHSNLQYGPLGSLLKRNIFNEWLYSLLKNDDFNIFPVEIPNPRKQRFLIGSSLPRPVEQLSPIILGNFIETNNSFGCPLPFGFAVYGPCMNENVTTVSSVDVDLNFLSNLKAWTRTSIVFFCPSKKSIHWFHYWSKQRYLWWRKFSSIPSKFSLSEVVMTTSGCEQQLSINLESPWGKDSLETITLYRESFIKESVQKCNERGNILVNQKFPAATVVTCEAELDLAVLAYLSNSYAEKWRDRQIKNVFHLHYKLAPYKVCISLEEANSENLKKLKNVASHLTKELKATGISIFPTSDFHFQTSAPSQFDRFDEMGIPYTIVLNENSLLTGIAGLRNRDTILQEQVHITDLTSKLIKYLKIKTGRNG